VANSLLYYFFAGAGTGTGVAVFGCDAPFCAADAVWFSRIEREPDARLDTIESVSEVT
jgi:hypothetical protein